MGPNSEIPPADAVAQLRAFDTAARSVPQLDIVLASPAVSMTRKRAVIRAIASAIGLTRITINFLLVLSDHRRWDALHEVIESLDAELDSRLGFERAEVRSAYELSEAQREELAGELSRITGRKIRLRYEVDPDLIGGVTARVASTVYDGSVRGQLAGMRQSLAANRY
jgi:F-type H+-transporting ATPase subunit delta